MTEHQGSFDHNHSNSQMPQQSVFENVQVGRDLSFRDLLQILLVPGRDGQQPEHQGILHNLPQPDYGQFVGREQELKKYFKSCVLILTLQIQSLQSMASVELVRVL
jgi:hypothetical protein